jgi:hypothetical protein
MRKIFAILAALYLSGCVTVMQEDGTRQRFLFLQAGVMLRVVNNCAPSLTVESVSGVMVSNLAYGSSITIPLAPAPLSRNRQLVLVAKGAGSSREYLGSQTRTFYTDPSQGTREEVWEIDHLSLPNGRGGCI